MDQHTIDMLTGAGSLVGAAVTFLGGREAIRAAAQWLAKRREKREDAEAANAKAKADAEAEAIRKRAEAEVIAAQTEQQHQAREDAREDTAVHRLEKRLDRTESRLDACEERHADCERRNDECEKRVADLRVELGRVSRRLDSLSPQPFPAVKEKT